MFADVTQTHSPILTETPLRADSETGQLKTVIIGTAENFDLSRSDIINETQKKYYFGPNRPQKRRLAEQLERYVQCLESCGVTVLRPRPLDGVYDQLMPRDIGVTIGNRLLRTRMANPSRQHEWEGIEHHVTDYAAAIIQTPDDVIIEGGDIVVDNGRIFVGISQRTTYEGAEWLAATFPDHEVIPVVLKTVEDGENILHLDCGFVPVGPHHALIYADGIVQVPQAITDNYELIPVARAEQDMLGTNVLSISPNELISRASSVRINQQLREIGLEVHALDFTEAPKT